MIRLIRNDKPLDVPCGSCGNCLQNKRKEWSYRLSKENRYRISSHFLTLTYHDLSLPWADDQYGNTYPVLCKEDFQKFMKRLRKKNAQFTEDKIKYYAVGEYGTQTHRPHYHAIVFDMDIKVIPFLSDIWKIGFIKVGTVTMDSIDYVTKYVVTRNEQKHYLVPPFALISKGIGLDHYHKNKSYYDRAQKIRNQRGYKQVVPKYYRDKNDTIKNPFTEAILKEKQKLAGYDKEKRELERLQKLHPDPVAYLRERELDSSNRILSKAKKGGKI